MVRCHRHPSKLLFVVGMSRVWDWVVVLVGETTLQLGRVRGGRVDCFYSDETRIRSLPSCANVAK